MHGLVRCKHERRCSHACEADVSFRDVTIRIPERGCDQRCEWRHAPEAWAEIWVKWVSWVLPSEEEGWLSLARRGLLADAARVVVADGKVIIERLCLSLPYVEKPLNSKVIKSFVPELRSRKCFLCFGIPTLSICALWTFSVHFTYHVWVCNTKTNIFIC